MSEQSSVNLRLCGAAHNYRYTDSFASSLLAEAAETIRTLTAERDEAKTEVEAAHELLHDGAPIEQGTSQDTLRPLTLVERIRVVFGTLDHVGDQAEVAEAQLARLRPALDTLRETVEGLSVSRDTYDVYFDTDYPAQHAVVEAARALVALLEEPRA